MNTITITLPLPDGSTSGHAKGHWRGKAQATKRMRHEANIRTRFAVFEGNASEWQAKRAKVSLAFYLATNRRRDVLNLANGCKPYIDGIVDAGIIPDDDWKVLSVGAITCELDRDNPRVDITITEAA